MVWSSNEGLAGVAEKGRSSEKLARPIATRRDSRYFSNCVIIMPQRGT